MTAGATTNFSLVTLQANDQSTEAWSKTNFETIDSYLTGIRLLNNSGSTRSAGDVVIIDTTTASAFTTTASAGSLLVVGVVQETALAGAQCLVRTTGIATQVKVTAATAKGDWLTTSTTAGSALNSNASNPPTGAFARALTSTAGAGTVTALLMTPSPGVSGGGTPALVLSTSNVAGNAATFIRTNDQIALFDATVPVTQAFADAAATGSAAFAARRDHKHGMPSLVIPEFLTPMTPSGATTTTAGGPVQNQVYFYPLHPILMTTTLTQIVYKVGTQNGNIDLGVYSFDGTTMTKVATTGSTACPASGIARTTLSATLNPGTRYYLAFITDSASATFIRLVPSNDVVLNWPPIKSGQSIPLAASYTSLSMNSGSTGVPAIYGNVSTGMQL